MIRKAEKKDISEILSLLEPYVQKGIVLPRTESDILDHLDLFYVAEDSASVVGIISHYRYSFDLMEIRSLAVREDHYSRGIGSDLIRHVIMDLRQENPNVTIFALTLATDFFSKCGFDVVKKETFPEKIWKDCSKCIKKDCCDEIPMIYMR